MFTSLVLNVYKFLPDKIEYSKTVTDMNSKYVFISLQVRLQCPKIHVSYYWKSIREERVQ